MEILPEIIKKTLTILALLFLLLAEASAGKYVWKRITTKDGLSSDLVYSVAVLGDTVWFGTYGGGAVRYEKSRNTFKIFTTKGENLAKFDDGSSLVWKNLPRYMEITAIAVDGNTLWFGTDFYGKGGGGFSHYDPSTGKWTLYNTENGLIYKKVLSLAVDGDYLWVGTKRGVSRFDKRKQSFKNLRLGGNYINSILPTPDSVWFATNDGIIRLDKGTYKTTNYTGGNRLPEEEAKALALVGQEIWAGFSDGALARFNPSDKSWHVFNSEDPLGRMPVNSILATKDKVYVAKDGGVSIYDIKIKKWSAITAREGLESQTVFSIALDTDGVWFGTDSGAYKMILR